MPRKKRPPSKGGGDSPNRSINVVSYLPVSIQAGKKQGAWNPITVTLHASDASRLDVRERDAVLVIGPGILLVATVEKISGKKPGILPLTPASRVWEEDASSQQTVATPITPSPPSTNPSTPHSFKSLVSSPKSPTTPQQNHPQAWLVSCQSPLGRRIQARHVRPLQSLVLDSTDDWISRLVRIYAKYTHGSTVCISYRGQAQHVSIVSYQVESMPLEEELEQLQLQDETAIELQQALQDVILYEITASTDISLKPIQQEIRLPPCLVGLDDFWHEVQLFVQDQSRNPFGISRGLLIHGPSGIGKTRLVQHVVQDAQYMNSIDLLYQTNVDWNQCTKNVDILVLDDIHRIGAQRTAPDDPNTLLTSLLAWMDGIDSNTTPRVIGITHSPQLLDRALRRPGRFDTEIEVPMPTAVMRSALLRHFVSTMKSVTLREDVYDEMGSMAKGFHAADCLLAVKEATRRALSRPDNLLTRADLQGAIRATKPSSIQAIAVEVPTVYWSDIGGMSDVKAALQQAMDLPNADLFRRLHMPAPRGILLYGPPGCSKTLMARAMATEGQCNFLAVQGPELLSKWLGESERALASLFRRARQASPCIVFMDEVDAMAASRGRADSSTSGRLLSQLLTELDGIGTEGRVLVVGATNRPDLLDAALVRPGRMDRQIYVPPPDEASRQQILKITLEDKPCSNDVDLPELARRSEGYSGAEVVAICRKAALLVLEQDGKEISMEHLEQAMHETHRQITPEMLQFYESYRQGSLVRT